MFGAISAKFRTFDMQIHFAIPPNSAFLGLLEEFFFSISNIRKFHHIINQFVKKFSTFPDSPYYILKYHALGDLCIFIIFGILVPLGVTYSMTSTLDWHIVAVTAPIGLLIVNILHANNTRDIRDDGKASITTQAMLLGLKCSKYKYVVYTILAYAGILACCILGILPWTCVAVVLTAPIAVRNTKCMFSAHSTDHPEAIKSLDSMTAQLVIAFGLIQILAIAASTITHTP